MATLDQQIADFTAFAKALSASQGSEISLDEAFQQWRAIDPKEVALLKERYEAYLAEGPGEPADEVMTKLRKKLVAKYGDL